MIAKARDSELVSIDREWVRRRGLREFVRRAWSQVEPAELVWSWHLDAMCEHLEAVAHRDIRDLVINLPPGLSKSKVTSVLFPAWLWTFAAERRFLCASYSGAVALRDARAMRTLIVGNWYRDRWPEVQLPRDDSASSAAAMFENTRKGFRKSDTTRGQWTGEHGDDAIVDDPLDPQGAASPVELDACLEWWTGTMPTRFRDHATSTRTLIMQRLHERDLTSEFVRNGATVLCLPMRYEARHPHAYARDPRTTDGELLCPARVSEEEASKLARRLGPTRAAAQLQQRPTPAGGAVFRAEWFQRWTELPATGIWYMSVDCTFKATTDGSYVVIQVWLQSGPNLYLVDQRRERMDFNATVAAILAMSFKYPKVVAKLIEAKANGPAVVSVLKGKVSGLIEIEPEGGKEARANAAQPLVAGGNVFLPDEQHAKYPDGRKGAPWVPGFVHEAVTFPKGENDDQVDGMTQLLNHVSPSLSSQLEDAMSRIFTGR